MIDYGKAFSFFTEDEHWLEKLGIGVGVYIGSFVVALLVAIVPSFLFYLIMPWPVASNLASGLTYFLSIMLIVGYGLRLMNNVRAGDPRPLPVWDDWGNDLIRGFKLVVVAIIWTLPLILLSIPTAIGTSISDNGSASMSAFGSMMALCGGCLSLLYWLFLAVAAPGYTLAFLRDEQIQSGVRFDVVYRWTRDNLASIVPVALVTFLAGIIIFFLGVVAGAILLCVGWLITLPLGVLLPVLIQYHLYGQLARAFPMDVTSTPDQDVNGGPGAPAEGDFAPPALPA